MKYWWIHTDAEHFVMYDTAEAAGMVKALIGARAHIVYMTYAEHDVYCQAISHKRG